MTPYFVVTNQGQQRDYSAILLDLMITDESKEKADQFEIKLSDTAQSIILPKKGEQIQIAIGQDGQAVKTGQYIVDEVDIEGPPDIIQIRGSAAPFQNAGALYAMQTRKTRSWDNITLGSLVSGIASEHGLTAAVDPSLQSVQIVHLDQTRESNLNLLTRLARVYGGIFKPVNGALALAAQGTGNAVTGAPMAPVAITRGPGMKWKCAISKRTDFDSCHVSYPDTAAGKIKTVDDQGNDVPISTDGATQPDTSKIHHDHAQAPNLDVAQRTAKSKLNFFKMGSCTLELNLPGATWAVTAEQKLSLTGWRPEINGMWIAKKITITLSRSTGLRTLIECDTPGDGSEPREQVGSGGVDSSSGASNDTA